MTKPTHNPAANRRDWLFPILMLFTVTFFVYRDFDIRMLFGFAVLALVLMVHCMGRLLRNRPPRLDTPRMALLLLVCAVLLNFLRLDSRHNSDSFSFIISMVICAGFVILSRPTKKMCWVALGIGLGGALAVTFFVHFLSANPWYYWNWLMMKFSDTAASYTIYYIPKGYSFTLGGCTQTDYTLFLGLAICCGWVVSRRQFDWKSGLAMVLGAIFLYTILIVGRRGELLGAVICLAILILALCDKKYRRKLIIGGLIVCAVGFGLIVLLMPWLKQFPALHRYLWTVEWMLKGYDITSGRTELYALAWNAFLEHPLFGLGWDNFHTVIPASFQEVYGQNLVEDVHNIYLQFLAEAGILGAPFLMVPLFYIYWLVCRQFVRLKDSPRQTARMFCTVSFMIQSFLLVMGLFDPTFQKIVFWCFYGIALLLQCTALRLEKHTPVDPMSCILRNTTRVCAPLFVRFWNWAVDRFSRLIDKIREKKCFQPTFPDRLLLILVIFTVTFFLYRDLGIRMIFGFGALCLILMCNVLLRLERDRSAVVQTVHLPYLVLALVILLNFLRPDSRHDIDSTSYILSMLISCGLVLLADPHTGECRSTLKVLYWSGLLMAVFVIFFTIFDTLFWNTIFHILTPLAQEYLLFFVPAGYAITLGGCTYTCYILFFGMIACCARLCCSPRWTTKNTWTLLSFFVCLTALLLVGRRGELLAALVCTVILILAMCPPRRRRVLLLSGTVLGALLFGLVVLFLPQLKQISFLGRYITTLENLLSGQDISSGRLTLYQIALRAFRAHPLLGIGWDQYYTLVPPDYTLDPVVIIEDVHCIYLQFLCETGIVSTVLIVAPLLYYYYQVCAQFRRLKGRKMESAELNLAFGLCTCSFLLQTFLLFVGLYDPNFQRIIFWCFYGLAVLLMVAALKLEDHRPDDPVSRMLDRFLAALLPALQAVWKRLCIPRKEGNS